MRLWPLAAVIAAALALVALWTCARPAHSPVSPPAAGFDVLADPDLQLLVTPSPEGHQPFTRAIDGARASVDLAMFHLTDEGVVAALVRAAGRGVHVRVIVDGKGLQAGHTEAGAHANRGAFDQLQAGGVEARPSSAAFSITHEKAMVVDGQLAFITAINLTRDADRTRDLGVVTRRPEIAAAVEELFETDWQNAQGRGHVTPRDLPASLVVSPTGSRARLVALIGSARRELLVTVENLGDPEIDRALAEALHRHVALRVIVPMCDKNPNPLYNLPAARALAGEGADARVMPAPETPDTPYMHSKMILVDGATAYVGSVNFSANSTTKARELGIIFANAPAAAQIRTIFDADWAHAVPPPADDAAASCRR
ncbi:MAG TPA: phosphatidylserine/phosphatidylglycerophosphate/cardiolipin synthase family protein [Kofleriaceae bacterium]